MSDSKDPAQSPFSFSPKSDRKMDAKYKSPAGNVSPPVDKSENATGSAPFVVKEGPSDDEKEEYRAQLAELQKDIALLREALAEKLKKEQELKCLLGIGIVDDIKQDISQTVEDIRRGELYRKTVLGFRSAANKIQPTVQNLGDNVKRQVNFLRSNALFKSFEDTVTNTWSTVRDRVGASVPIPSTTTGLARSMSMNAGSSPPTSAAATGHSLSKEK